MQNNPLPGKHQIMPGESRVFSTENFQLAVRREKDGWTLLYTDHLPGAETGNPDFSLGEYFQTGKSNSLIIAPALPEKPLVFKGSRLHVSPGQKFTFFLKIPLTIQVYFSKTLPENLLKDISTQRLSDSWFGDPVEGMPAYSLGNEYYRTMADARGAGFHAICPVTIFNNSLLVLEIERLIVRVENMALYRNIDQFVTSQMLVEYKGKEVISSATYHYAKVYHGEKPDMVSKPRSETTKSLLKINLHFIKNLYKQEL